MSWMSLVTTSYSDDGYICYLMYNISLPFYFLFHERHAFLFLLTDLMTKNRWETGSGE